MNKKKILVLGSNGMLGNSVFNSFSKDKNFITKGTIRDRACLRFFDKSYVENIISNIDVLSIDDLISVFSSFKPDIVINCVGMVKQLEISNDPISILPLNSIFPHKLAKLCLLLNARLIHISTDCVFSGAKGNYYENDIPDAQDIYGRSKLLGEVNYENTVTLRTSIIGHELNSNKSLIDWFLAQSDTVMGYKNAYFSGLPTVVLANIIKDIVVPRTDINGLWHVSGHKISKYDLLNLVKIIYDKKIQIKPYDEYLIDRSLNSDKFRNATGWNPQNWDQLILEMFSNK
jgi:dTDP-4-dehydrorhamnose reductase